MSLPDDFGVISHLEAIQAALGALAGLDVLDIGCGDSALPRELAALGASCTGVDPFMPARDWEPVGAGRWRILQAAAEALPLAAASVDAAVFVFSLHHVPATALTAALGEVRRVLRPGGRLYVAEPLAVGDFNDVLATFHDERAVRAEAQAALRQSARAFGAHRTTAYTARRHLPDFETFASGMKANMRFNDYTAADIEQPTVKHRFDAIAARTGGIFDQPVKVDLLS